MGDGDRLARAYLLSVRSPGDSAVAALVAAHGAALAAELVAASAGGRWEQDATAIVEHGRVRQLRLVVPGDEQWPGVFSATGSAPLGLWVRGPGQLDRLASRAVGIVGATASTPYGHQVAAELGAGLAQAGWTVLTLGRFGVDGTALRAAMETAEPVGALPLGGLVEPQPPGHRDLFDRLARRGLLVSECGPPLPRRQADVARQTWLLAALVAAVVLVEPAPDRAEARCGTVAAEMGRLLLAVPGPVTFAEQQYAHELIRAGRARLVTGSRHVLHELSAASRREGGR